MFLYRAILDHTHFTNSSTLLKAQVVHFETLLVTVAALLQTLGIRHSVEVPDLKPAFDWDKVWVNVSLSSRNPDHQPIHYNFVRRVYLTHRKLHLMKVINDPICTFCSSKVIGSFFHMFRECIPVAEFWRWLPWTFQSCLRSGCPVCLLQ